MATFMTIVLSWFLVVTVAGQEVQKSQEPMAQETCIEMRDKYRAYVTLVSAGTGHVEFRGRIYPLSVIDIECVNGEGAS